MTIETGEKDVPLGVVDRGARSPHNIGELVREVDRHHVHPDEEADEGVVDGIAEEVAYWSEENFLPVNEVKAPFDSVQQEIETNVHEESHHQLAEKILSFSEGVSLESFWTKNMDLLSSSRKQEPRGLFIFWKIDFTHPLKEIFNIFKFSPD